MFQNKFVRRMQVAGFVSFLIVFAFLAASGIWENYFSNKNELSYNINNYFNDYKIEKIRIYFGSKPDESEFVKEITDTKALFGFIQSINHSYEYKPNHPISGKYYFVRVFMEGDKQYDLLIDFISQDGYVYIEDLNVNVPNMKSKSLRVWFNHNGVY